MIASSTASTIAIAIEATVSQIVQRTPRRICGLNRYFPTVGQAKLSLVIRALATIAASTSTTTADTQRPG